MLTCYKGDGAMEHILDEIRATYDRGIWYPTLSSILMMPDACGAIEFWGTTKTSRIRYPEWYDRWVYPHFSASNVTFDGSVVYIVRNAMIHEYSGFTRGKHGFDRILFMPPNDQNGRGNFNLFQNTTSSGETVFQVSILELLEAIDNGVRHWLADVRADPDKRREYALNKLVQLRPNGHAPYIIGTPIIS